ncbi:MAG: LysM domain-containing protein [Deltaproteobacteria bacterium]|jgi:LysM repeat protein
MTETDKMGRKETDFFEEIPEELGYPPEGESMSPTRHSSEDGISPRLVMAGCVGAVILIGLMAFFFSGRSEVSKKDLAILKSGLDRIETRLSELDMLKERVGSLEKEVNNIRTMASRRASSVKKRPHTPTATSAKSEYHTVRSGDSLYSIAKKYGLTVDRLVQINKLNPKKPIQPGQRLLVTP